jgi:hypothetical protein
MGKITALVYLGVMLSVSTVPTVNAGSDLTVSSAQGIYEAALIDKRPPLHGRFVRTETGVVEDRYLGLEWVVGPKKVTSWDEANSWVESLTVDGGGWRMPAREELRSLYQEGGGLSNHISAAFRTNCRFVWTGEKVGPQHAWGFCFGIGEEFWPRCSYSQNTHAFAVRSQRIR